MSTGPAYGAHSFFSWFRCLAGRPGRPQDSARVCVHYVMMYMSERSFRNMLALLAAAAGPAFVGGCATARLASGWEQSPVTADGVTDEWTNRTDGLLFENGLELAVRNDSCRLYVMARFRANDRQWAQAASLGGLTVRVTAPRRKAVGYRLADGPEPGDMNRTGAQAETTGRGHGMMRQRMEQMRAALAGKVAVIDAQQNETPVPADGSLGPAAGFVCKDGMCSYEFSIALRDSTQSRYGVAAKPGDAISVSVTAGLSAKDREAFREQMQPMPGRGMGRPPEGGFGEPGGSPRHGNWSGGRSGQPRSGSMPENPQVSVPVKLASGS